VEDQEKNELTKVYDLAMVTPIKSEFLDALVMPLKEKHEQGIYATVAIVSQCREKLRAEISSEINKDIPKDFPVSGSNLFGVPLVWEDNQVFDVKYIFEDGSSQEVRPR
jgi:hypothetical protein